MSSTNPFNDPSVMQAMRSTKSTPGSPMMEIPLPPAPTSGYKSTTSSSTATTMRFASPTPQPTPMMNAGNVNVPKSPYVTATSSASALTSAGTTIPSIPPVTSMPSGQLPPPYSAKIGSVPTNPNPIAANPYEENIVYPANENLMEELGNSIKKTDSAKILLFMRFVNLILSSATIIAGIFSFILGFTDSPKKIIAALYIISFGLLLLMFELRLGRFEDFIRENFGFMFGPKTRTMFLLFIAIWPLSMGNHWLTLVLALLLFLNALFNYFVVYNHPSFSEENAVDSGKSKSVPTTV